MGSLVQQDDEKLRQRVEKAGMDRDPGGALPLPGLPPARGVVAEPAVPLGEGDDHHVRGQARQHGPQPRPGTLQHTAHGARRACGVFPDGSWLMYDESVSVLTVLGLSLALASI